MLKRKSLQNVLQNQDIKCYPHEHLQREPVPQPAWQGTGHTLEDIHWLGWGLFQWADNPCAHPRILWTLSSAQNRTACYVAEPSYYKPGFRWDLFTKSNFLQKNYRLIHENSWRIHGETLSEEETKASHQVTPLCELCRAALTTSAVTSCEAYCSSATSTLCAWKTKLTSGRCPRMNLCWRAERMPLRKWDSLKLWHLQVQNNLSVENSAYACFLYLQHP